jgi:Family of unknown function (DUF6499)
MTGGSSWRSPSTADQYRDHDYADFAQEFLHRNADYRCDYAETKERIIRIPESEHHEKEGLSRRWGLSFPHEPANKSTPKPGSLVAQRIARRDRHRDCRSEPPTNVAKRV